MGVLQRGHLEEPCLFSRSDTNAFPFPPLLSEGRPKLPVQSAIELFKCRFVLWNRELRLNARRFCSIRTYLDGHHFDGETVRQMGIAFEMAMASLGYTPAVGDPIRMALARGIIALAQGGEDDPERLCEGACGGQSRCSGGLARFRTRSDSSRRLKFWRELRSQFRPNSLHGCPYFIRDDFEDGCLNDVAMNCLQFGWH
jgi:hypothetical protein